MKRILATAALVAAGLVSLPAHGVPSLFYHVRACTPGIDCDVAPHATAPGSPGPTNADFQQFYGTKLGVDLSGDTFAWSASTNANGYWFGSVNDTTDGIRTSYLWHTDRFVCCTIDEPYLIVDGNDSNLFIGTDMNGASNAGQPLYPAFIASPGGPTALPPFDYGLTLDSLKLVGNNMWSVRPVAIDDGERILASWNGPTGWLEFDPVDFRPPLLPEPATALLAVPFVLILLRFRRRTTP